jgi:Protein of unknown function (DUF3168)
MHLIAETRRAIQAKLKASPDVTGLVSASSIYPQATPANHPWPFIKTGAVSSLPFRASCFDGEIVSLAVHGFTKGTATIGAEDHAGQIGEAIKKALDRSTIDITGGRIRLRISDQQLLVDQGEADSFHYFAVVNARCIREAA